MKNAKKVLSVLLSLMLVLGTVAAGFTVSAADACLKVKGVEVDLCRDGTYDYGYIKYSAADHTLTFDDSGVYSDVCDCIFADSLGFDLIIKGSASVSAYGDSNCAIRTHKTNIVFDCESFYADSFCVTAATVDIDGTMTVNSGNVSVFNFAEKKAISVSGTITVNSGSLNAFSESEYAVSAGGEMTVNGGYVNAGSKSSSHSALNVTGKITVNGGSLKAVNKSGYHAVTAGGALTVGGGTVYAKTEISSYEAINAPEISLSNGEMFATGGNDAEEIQIRIPGNIIPGDVIMYGTYPQSRVTDETVLTALNEKLSGSGWISYGFYSSEGGYDAMQPGDFMKYQDIALDGVKYRAVTFTSYRPSSTHLPEGADNSHQDDNGYETGTVYWFRFDPLKWRVLDPDDGLIICDNTIESRPFNEFVSFVAGDDYEYTQGGTYYTDSSEYANAYAFSSIRRWLNEDFMNTAFSAEEKDNIVVSENLDNTDIEGHEDDDAYPKASDRVFLLSFTEATNPAYGLAPERYEDDAKIKLPSDYALCQGVFVYKNEADWLLRTPLMSGASKTGVAVNCFSGCGVHEVYFANDTGAGIVPAMRLSEIISTQGKKDPAITLSCLDETQVEGEELTITVRLPEDATGTVTLSLGNEKGTAAVSGDGTAEIKIAAVPGTHEVLVSYSGDDNYNMVSKERTVNIPKYLTAMELEISPKEPVSGEDITVTAILPDDAIGIVTFNLGTELEETAETKDGKAILALSGLNSGVYTLTAAYEGDNNYTEASAEISFNVKETAGITVSVSPEEPVCGEDITVTATVPDDATGSVTFSIDGIPAETVDVVKGKAGYSYERLISGDYTLTAVYSGDDKYLEESAEINFAVNKATPEVTVTVSPEETVYGDKVTVTVNYPADATVWSEIPQGTGDPHPAGMITIELDGDILTTTDGSEGVLVYELPAASFGAGGHTVKITFNGDDKYSCLDVETAFTAAKKDVTITANNQEYFYNGSVQGEGDTIYDDPDLIAQKASAVSLADGDYIASITLDGQAQDPGTHENVIEPVNAVIKNAAGIDVSSNYNISYENGDIIINTPSVPLTINYIYEGGSEAAPAYRGSIALYMDYSVISPSITGYTPDKATVAGTMGDDDMGGKTVTVTYTANIYTVTYIVDGKELTSMEVTFGQPVPQPRTPQKDGFTFAWTDKIPEKMPAENITVNGGFTAIDYTATFVDESGVVVAEVPYTVETQSIEAPAVPGKDGYTAAWEDYTLEIGGVTVKPVYTAIEYTATFVDENGAVVAEVPYTVETQSIEAPAVPGKDGYSAAWEDYTLDIGGVTVKPVYTVIEYTATFVDENGAVVAEIPYTVETQSIEAPAVPEKGGYAAAWEDYELAVGGVTVKPVYTPENICKLDGEYHGESFWGRVRTFFHNLIWSIFAFFKLNVFFKVSF